MNALRKLILAAVLAGGIGWFATSARADAITVTTTTDSVAADGLKSLREAAQQASVNGVEDDAELLLEAGASYELTLCGLGALDHTDAQNLNVHGNGGTVTQTCADMEIMRSSNNAATLTIDGLNLVGGANTGVTVNGAGIYSEGHFVLDGSTVSGVDAGPGGVVIDGAMGSVSPFDITISQSSLTGNTGRVVNIDFGSVQITESQITGNTGDAVALIDGSPLEITDSTISGNTGRGVSTTGGG